MASESFAEADTTLMLGEVNVTAIKSAGHTAMAGVAVTTINSDEARRLGIVAMKDVSALSPNFYIPEYGSRMTSSIYMRGLGARIDQPAVGLNVDNVPVMNKDAFDFDITDIERIEVIRGPQSTMYGRNTMAGLINITTSSPLSSQGFRAMLEGGSGSTVRCSATGLFKVTENAGMSLSAQYGYFGGYFKNQHSGAMADRSRDLSARWKTEARLTDNLHLVNTASMTHGRQNGYPYAYDVTGEINYNDTCFYKRTTVTDGLTVKWTAPAFTAVSITSYQYIDDNMTLDQDFLPLDYFTLTQKRREHAVTQEFVLKGDKNRYGWIAGVFGFIKHASMAAPVTFKADGIESLITDHVNSSNPTYPIRWDDDTFELGSDFINNVRGISAYHKSSYETGNWNLSAGLRVDIESTALNYHSHTSTSYTTYNLTDPSTPEIYAHHPVEINDRGRLSHTYTTLLPSVTASYSLKFGELYASAGKGYKAGGFNTQMFSDVLQQRVMSLMGISERYDVDRIVSYKPEKCYNFEGGMKITMPEHKLSATMALFYIDCRDQQLTTFPDGTTTGRIMTNAGRTRSMGAELTAAWQPHKQWFLNMAYGHTDARFRQFHNGKADFSGKRMPYAPSNTLFLSARYTKPVKSSVIDSFSFDLNLRGVGPIWWDEANETWQPFYAQVGAIAQVTFSHGSLQISGENLTATKFDTFRYVSIGRNFYQRGNPASCKITLRIFI